MQVSLMYHSAIGLSNRIRVEIKANVSGFGRHSSQRRAAAEGTHNGCPYGKPHGGPVPVRCSCPRGEIYLYGMA